MSKLISVVLLALCAGAATTSIAPAYDVVQQVKPSYTLSLKLAPKCRVEGSPAQFPDDIQLGNAGSYAMPAGTKIKWKLDAYNNYGGVHTLLADLAPGKWVLLNHVFPGGVEAGQDCTVSIQ
jgi:hypothetical protein